MIPWYKRYTIKLMIVAVLLTSVFGTFGFIEPARAQWSTNELTSIPNVVNTTRKQILDGLKSALLTAASRVLSYAMRKIAYDGAVWLASGGKGQTPFAHTKGFGDYLGGVADDALGQGLEAMGSKFGISNLCKLPNIETDLALRIGLRTGFKTPDLGLGGNVADPTQKAGCTFSSFVKTWTDGNAWKSKFDAAGQQFSVTDQLNNALNFSSGGGGGLLTVIETKDKISQQIQASVEAQKLARTEGQGVKEKVTAISKQIQIPASVIKKEFESNRPGDLQAKDEAQMQALLTTGDIKVIPNVLGMFLNTLVSTMVKNYKEKGILPFGAGCAAGKEGCLGGETVASFEGSGFVSNRAAAEDLFSSFLTVKIGSEDSYDILSELGNCEGKGTYNCRADQGLILAARQTAGGETVTIGEALKTPGSPMLHPEWKLIPYKGRDADNANLAQFCSHAYCEANIKVLRQIRLLPLGFEIAAHNSDPDRPWTLGQVVAGFNDCKYNETTDANGNIVKTVVPDPVKHPFCHLIDPNWVLKVPESRCNAMVNSAVQLTKDAPTRLEDCADLSSCVAYNADGTCANFAYCTREKNTWDFGPADKCESQWRSCQTYSNESGTVSYLQRTLDTGSCAQSDVGCRAYSLNQGVVNGKMQWLDPKAISASDNFTQQAIFFNNQLPQTCSANAAGCSAFQVASSTDGDFRYLRKAPDYLGCYDSDNNRQNGVQWPKTSTDLNRITKNSACDAYAGVCTAEEVGCASYTSKNTGDSVPGKISQQNVCASECVGYNAYQEIPSNYSNGQSVVYAVIQHNTGPLCTKQEVGCSSFTNLSTAIGGQENVEHFAYLRPCELPDKKPTKVFTTFEGSTQGGFQLKTYTLVADVNGAPAQWTKVPSDAQDYVNPVNGCTEANYIAKKTVADCRQFNDTAGKVYYALLEKTIPVTDQCTPYRLNSSELNPLPTPANGGLTETQCSARKGYWNQAENRCELCFQNGEFINGFCTYFGLSNGVNNAAGNSISCSAAVESCREYKGNEGYNVKIYPTDTFEVADTQKIWYWNGSNLKITKESTHAGEQSLGVVGSSQVATRFVSSTPGQSYIISFFAKGNNTNFTVDFVENSNNNPFVAKFGDATISDTWRQYSFGPIQYNGKIDDAKIVFSLQQNGALYIDNFSIQRINGVEYRIKNKLTVPASCDADPNDNLPGASLGCSIYTTGAAKTSVYLTGFDYLCRDKAIGCSPFIDTHNTLPQPGQNFGADKGDQLYKVFLPGDGTANTWKLFYNGNSIASCTTVLGEAGCTVDLINVSPSDLVKNGSVNNDPAKLPVITPSTVYIPADNLDTPIYLVNNPNLPGQCSATDLGCVTAGQQTQTPAGLKYTTTTIKNDPALYSTTLCKQESVGCSAWNDTNGGTSYFRDPTVVGQKLCEYKAATPSSVGSGWFWKGVGKCKANGSYCSADSDCDGVKGSCENIGEQPCYSNYLDSNGQFGLWSFGDTGKYNNFVGLCPANKNGCTEFVDHNDINVNGTAQASYFIKNSKISSGDCNGLVSQKSGCVLFDDTSNPSKYWATTPTYDLSNASDGVGVKPVVGNNDANLILKVQQNRECGEWIQCRHAFTEWDTLSGKPKTVCQDIGRCAKADPADPSQCAQWIDGNYPLAGNILDEISYQFRRAVWSEMDYSGFSILNQFPVEELRQVNISADTNKPDWRLVKTVLCGGGASCLEKNPNSKSTECDPAVSKLGVVKCGYSQEGLCYNSTCIRPIDASAADEVTKKLGQQKQICRAYPESDSPFPNSPEMAKLTGGGSQLFTAVKVCNEYQNPQSNPELAGLCDCDYTKVKYGDSTFERYWNYLKPATYEALNWAPKYNPKTPKDPNGKVSNPSIPNGICLGGNKDGAVCDTDTDCYTTEVSGGKSTTIPTGSCQVRKAQNSFLGWKGFCLEYDMSRYINGNQNQHPCLTWYPIDTLNGAADISSQHVEAGYVDGGKPFYCLASNGGANFDRNDPAKWLAQQFKDPLSVQRVFSYKTTVVLDTVPDYNNFKTKVNGANAGCAAGNVGAIGGCAVLALGFSRDDGPWVGTPLEKYGAPQMDLEVKLLVGEITGQMTREFHSAASMQFDNAVGQLHMEDIDRIILDPKNGDNEDPKNGAQFEIYPNDFNATISSPQTVYEVVNRAGERGLAVTGRYLARPNELVLFYGGDGGGAWNNRQPFVDSSGNVCYGLKGTCNALSGNLFTAGGLAVPIVPGGQPDQSPTVPGGGTDGIWNDKSLTRNFDLCPWGNGLDHNSNVGGNWHALRFKFDPNTHVFTGYDTAYCDDSGGSGNIDYDITFRLKEWCPVLGEGKSPNTDQTKQTVAWTNRLWLNGKFVLPNPFGLSAANYIYSTADLMFGKTSITSNFAHDTQTILFATQPTQDDFCDKINGGPCTHNLQYPLVTDVGAPYSCANGTCVRSDNNPIAAPVYPPFALSDGRLWLGSLFAKLSSLQVFNTTINLNNAKFNYVGYTSQNDSVDYRAIGDPVTFQRPVMPRVNSVAVGSCKSSGQFNGQCLEDVSKPNGGVTINNKSSGLVKVFNTAAKVYMNFYMYADDNQMPIRNVTVDWLGNQNINTINTRPGYFYNQRGLTKAFCRLVLGRPTNCNYKVGNTYIPVTPNIDCTQDSDCSANISEQCLSPDVAPSFGYIKSPDSENHITCQNHYYETYNVYNCSKASQNYQPNGCGDDDSQFKDGCCVYKPRVQVKDNWGWCNGTCNPGDLSCWDGGASGFCNNPKAWTTFEGTVIVAPQK